MARRTFAFDLTTFGILALALGAMAAWLAFIALGPAEQSSHAVPRMIAPSVVPPAAADAPPYAAGPGPLSRSSDGTTIAPDWILPSRGISHGI